jgi:hypothetical protein
MFGLAAVLVAFVLGGGGAVALTASSTPASSTIHVCRSAKTGALFLWGSCPKGYLAYSWAVTGPAGPRGATGLTGPRGAAGPSFARPFTLAFAIAASGPYLSYTCSATQAGGVGDITQVTCSNPVGILTHNGGRR